MASNENKCTTEENKQLSSEETAIYMMNRKELRMRGISLLRKDSINSTAQEQAPVPSTDAMDTREREEENLAPNKDLQKELEMLTYQLKMEQEDKENLKLLHQAEDEKSRVWIEQLQKHHRDQLQAKEALIRRLKKEKSSAFSNIKKKAGEDTQEEIRRLTTTNSLVRGQLERANEKVQILMDAQSKKSLEENAQRAALTQNLKKELQEKEVLKALVAKLESKLKNQEQATAAALDRGDLLEKEKQELKDALDSERQATGEAQGTQKVLEAKNQLLTGEVTSLKSALIKEVANNREAKAKLMELEIKNEQQNTELMNLQTALSEVQAMFQTLQGEKNNFESTVAKLRSSLSKEQRANEVLRSTVSEEKEKTQTINQTLQNERVKFKVTFDRFHARCAHTLEEKDEIIGAGEQERLVQEGRIQELSAALLSSEKTVSALTQKNDELQDAKKRQKRRWWCFRRA